MSNQSQFSCKITGIPDETFQVQSFTTLHEDGLSADYQIQVLLQSEVKIALDAGCGRAIKLALDQSRSPKLIHGIITEFVFIGPLKNISAQGRKTYGYSVILSSPLAILKLNQHNRIFCNKSQNVVDVIKKVLEKAKISGTALVDDLQGSYSEKEFIIQYNESDYDFLARITAHCGIFFRFEQEKSQAVLHLHDSVINLPTISGEKLPFEALSGTNRDRETIYGFRPQARLKTKSHSIKDFDYLAPESRHKGFNSWNKDTLPSQGESFLYGENIKSVDEASLIAKVRTQEQDWQRQVFVADTDCRSLVPGYKFTMVNHQDKAVDKKTYLVVQIEHHGDQSAGQALSSGPEGKTYWNKVLLIPAEQEYRPKLPPPHKVHTNLTARIETTGGPYAMLDEQGRYRLRFDMDQSETTKGSASHAVRQMQPYGGEDYGLHLPLHAGTEVAINCMNGDLDRPFILGVLPNPDSASPVDSHNFYENIIRTTGGNELLMADLDGKEKVALFTKDKQNILTLDADYDGHKVELITKQGEMTISAAKTMLIESGSNEDQECGADQLITIENKQQLLTKNKEIEHQSATDINLQAAENILFQAETKDAIIIAEQELAIETAGSFATKVTKQNIELMVEQGSVNIQAANNITIAGKGDGDIFISQAEQGGIAINKDGDLIFDGPSLTISDK